MSNKVPFPPELESSESILRKIRERETRQIAELLYPYIFEGKEIEDFCFDCGAKWIECNYCFFSDEDEICEWCDGDGEFINHQKHCPEYGL